MNCKPKVNCKVKFELAQMGRPAKKISYNFIYYNDFFFQLAVDIICDQVPYLDGFAHRGILSGANRIMTEGKETLKKAFEEHPDYRLVITGHSLGAGTAILISLGFLNNIYANDFPNVKEVKCIALAPPPVYRTGMFFEENKLF